MNASTHKCTITVSEKRSHALQSTLTAHHKQADGLGDGPLPPVHPDPGRLALVQPAVLPRHVLQRQHQHVLLVGRRQVRRRSATAPPHRPGLYPRDQVTLKLVLVPATAARTSRIQGGWRAAAGPVDRARHVDVRQGEDDERVRPVVPVLAHVGVVRGPARAPRRRDAEHEALRLRRRTGLD